MRSILSNTTAATTAAAALVAALAVGALALSAAPAAAAAAPPVVAGSATWGYKDSYRTYVAEELGRVPNGPAGRAAIAVTGGASFTGNEPSARKPSVNKAAYRWTATGGSLDRTGKGTVRFGGAVSYSYPNHYIQLTRYSNLTVVLDGQGKGRLNADLALRLHEGQAGETPVNSTRSQVHLADLTNARAKVTGSTATLVGADVSLTATGAKETNGFYSAGEPLDDLSFSVSLKTASGSTGSGSASAAGNGAGGSTRQDGATTTGRATPTASTGASATATGSPGPTGASAAPSTAALPTAPTEQAVGASPTSSIGEGPVNATDAASAGSDDGSAGPLVLALAVAAAAVLVGAVAAGTVLVRRRRGPADPTRFDSTPSDPSSEGPAPTTQES